MVRLYLKPCQPSEPLTWLNGGDHLHVAAFTQVAAQSKEECFHTTAVHGVGDECYARTARHSHSAANPAVQPESEGVTRALQNTPCRPSRLRQSSPRLSVAPDHPCTYPFQTTQLTGPPQCQFSEVHQMDRRQPVGPGGALDPRAVPIGYSEKSLTTRTYDFLDVAQELEGRSEVLQHFKGSHHIEVLTLTDELLDGSYTKWKGRELLGNRDRERGHIDAGYVPSSAVCTHTEATHTTPHVEEPSTRCARDLFEEGAICSLVRQLLAIHRVERTHLIGLVLSALVDSVVINGDLKGLRRKPQGAARTEIEGVPAELEHVGLASPTAQWAAIGR